MTTPDRNGTDPLKELFRNADDPEFFGQLRTIFGMLGDETRLRTFGLLLRTRELNVTELCDALGGMPQPAVSHHLALMRTSGVLEVRRDGKNNFYSISRCFDQNPAAAAILSMLQREWKQWSAANAQIPVIPAATEDLSALADSTTNGGTKAVTADGSPEAHTSVEETVFLNVRAMLDGAHHEEWDGSRAPNISFIKSMLEQGESDADACAQKVKALLQKHGYSFVN